MRKINPASFRLAQRGTSRDINRRIALNLIRVKQPVSRADLARLMGTRRGAITLLVKDLIDEGLVFEGAKGETARGRKPKFLYIDSRKRCIVAIDIRLTRTYLMVTDLVGTPLVGISSFATVTDPKRFVRLLARRVAALLADHRGVGRCQGIGVVVPGMVDRSGNRVMYAPRLGWHDVPLREPLAAATGLPVQIENSGKACALAQLWAPRGDDVPPGDFVYVSVSDGLGIGVVVRGEIVRGRHNIAGEIGHTPLSIDGPPCGCGAAGCWEAYVSNITTLSRYFGLPLSPRKPLPVELASFTVDDLIARARGGDGKAMAALQSTARYLGLGLASVVNTIDPSRIYLGGEICAAWDLIEGTVREALRERVLAPAARDGDTEIVIVPAEDHPRLRGAAALVSSPAFAAPEVA